MRSPLKFWFLAVCCLLMAPLAMAVEVCLTLRDYFDGDPE
jgi:hypothetical protein